jgi:hypothetical protein
MREHHTKEVLAFLEARYPTIEHKKQTVKYDPERHEFQEGEAVFYLDGEPSEENVRRGVVEKVIRCLPWNYAAYVIGGAKEEYYSCCLVWPDMEGQKVLNLANARKLIAESEK